MVVLGVLLVSGNNSEVSNMAPTPHMPCSWMGQGEQPLGVVGCCQRGVSGTSVALSIPMSLLVPSLQPPHLLVPPGFALFFG